MTLDWMHQRSATEFVISRFAGKNIRKKRGEGKEGRADADGKHHKYQRHREAGPQERISSGAITKARVMNVLYTRA